MNARRILEIGGVIAGALMIAFGVVALVLGVDARGTVTDELSAEYIVGSADMTPAEIKKSADEAGLTVALPTCDVAGKEIKNGSDARCFGQYMRIHALESTGGLTYAQMGRFVAADNPDDPAGTNDTAAALTDESGAPVSNGRRNTWVTETALATALNVSYMAEQIALFGIVVGIALLLSGIGFMILAVIVLGSSRATAASEKGMRAPTARDWLTLSQRRGAAKGCSDLPEQTERGGASRPSRFRPARARRRVVRTPPESPRRRPATAARGRAAPLRTAAPRTARSRSRTAGRGAEPRRCRSSAPA